MQPATHREPREEATKNRSEVLKMLIACAQVEGEAMPAPRAHDTRPNRDARQPCQTSDHTTACSFNGAPTTTSRSSRFLNGRLQATPCISTVPPTQKRQQRE